MACNRTDSAPGCEPSVAPAFERALWFNPDYSLGPVCNLSICCPALNARKPRGLTYGAKVLCCTWKVWLRGHATTDTDTRSKLLCSQVSAALTEAHRTSVRSPKEPQGGPELIDKDGPKRKSRHTSQRDGFLNLISRCLIVRLFPLTGWPPRAPLGPARCRA